jgi:large subunit ribosomal protein L25
MTTDTIELKAWPREQVGKANRKLRPEGKVPAVLYGAGHDSEPLSLDAHDLEMLFHHEGVKALVLKIKIEGTKTPVNAMIKAVQTNEVKGTPMHVDLLAINMNEAVHTVVPLHFEGDSPGVKEGGTLMPAINEIHIDALPKDLPEAIVVDISELDMTGAITVADLVAPKGVTITDDAETIVVSVAAPAKSVDEEETEEAAEPEVVGESEDSEEE